MWLLLLQRFYVMFHYQETQTALIDAAISLEEKEHTELGWDSYNEITSMLTWLNPNEENTVNAVIVIDESVRPKLAKFHVLKLHHSKIKT